MKKGPRGRGAFEFAKPPIAARERTSPEARVGPTTDVAVPTLDPTCRMVLEQTAVSDTDRPIMAEVRLLNDDETTMEFVVQVIEGVVGKTREEAPKLVFEIDREGSSECGVYTVERASNVVSRVAELDATAILYAASSKPSSNVKYGGVHQRVSGQMSRARALRLKSRADEPYQPEQYANELTFDEAARRIDAPKGARRSVLTGLPA